MQIVINRLSSCERQHLENDFGCSIVECSYLLFIYFFIHRLIHLFPVTATDHNGYNNGDNSPVVFILNSPSAPFDITTFEGDLTLTLNLLIQILDLWMRPSKF